MQNIIADFTVKNCDTLRLKGLTQWDYGRVLEIRLENMPETFEAHFSYKGFDDALIVEVTPENGVATIPIPNIITTQDKDATCWIYYEDETSGATYKTIILSITPRTKPSDYVYTETEVFNYRIFKKELEAKIVNLTETDKTLEGAINEIKEHTNVITISCSYDMEWDEFIANKSFDEIVEIRNKCDFVILKPNDIDIFICGEFSPSYIVFYRVGLNTLNPSYDSEDLSIRYAIMSKETDNIVMFNSKYFNLSDFLDIRGTYLGLSTESKSIIGAINEIKTELENLKGNS